MILFKAREVNMNKRIVVIGGAVVDLFAYPHQKIVMNDSNPGYLTTSFGGGGSNIAENLARLGIDITLITVLGSDASGIEIRKHAESVGLKLSIVQSETTPSYLSIMDEHKDTVVAIAAMDQILYLTKEEIKKRSEILNQADLIVIDTNLSEDTLSYIIKNFHQPIYVDAISGPKSVKLKKCLHGITGLKMNSTEASYISDIQYKSHTDLDNLGSYFIKMGVKEVYITLGAEGSFYMNENESQFTKAIEVPILNTTGAGDAFFAGAIYAKLNQKKPLAYAMASAAINLQDEKAVSSLLTAELLEKTKKEYNL
jgi:pseudouridine kinase